MKIARYVALNFCLWKAQVMDFVSQTILVEIYVKSIWKNVYIVTKESLSR